MKHIKAAFFGAGSMARMHARNVLADGRVDIAGICSRSRESAEALSFEIGRRVSCYSDFSTMLKEVEPDVLFVCVPPYVHGGEVEEAAGRGIHLFLEKPLSLELHRAGSMVDAVKKAGVISQVDFHHRFHPLVRRIKGLFDQDIAGRPLLMQARYFCNSQHTQWWRDKNLSGGQLFEQAIHLFDLMLFFMGPIKHVQAFQSNLCHRNQEDYTVEDTSAVTMLSDSEGMVSLAASNCAVPRRWEAAFHLVCENITAYYSSIEPGYIMDTRDSKAKPYNDSFNRDFVEPHKAALIEFLKAVRDGSGVSVPIQEGYKAQKLVMRAIQSAALTKPNQT